MDDQTAFMIFLLGVYIVGTLVVMVSLYAGMREAITRLDPEGAKWCARAIFWAPLWPVLLLLWFIRGLYRGVRDIIKYAFLGSDHE